MTGSFGLATFAVMLAAGGVILLVAVGISDRYHEWRDRRHAAAKARRRAGYIGGRR